MMKTMTKWISMAAIAATTMACALEEGDISIADRAEAAGATDLHATVPESVPEMGPTGKPMCGGFAGLECPDGLTCIDFPGDGCSPDKGGADCPGMCVGGKPECNFNNDPSKDYVGESLEICAVINFLCPEGTEYFSDKCGCGCQDISGGGGGGGGGGGQPCGDKTCGAGLECCNESCGICVEPGGFCTQQACVPGDNTL